MTTARTFTAAIDPMALMFPPDLYAKLVEGPHPHVPRVADVAKVLQATTVEQRTLIVERAKTLIVCGKLVEEAAAAKV